jgi:uncharacterized delta-60 repeat protein
VPVTITTLPEPALGLDAAFATEGLSLRAAYQISTHVRCAADESCWHAAQYDVGVSRQLANGSFDADFGDGGSTRFTAALAISSMERTADLGGFIAHRDPSNGLCGVARLDAAGDLVTAFGGDGVVLFAPTAIDDAIVLPIYPGASGLVVPDGDAVFVATQGAGSGEAVIFRLTAAGALDPAFGTGGVLFTATPGANDPEGAIFVNGALTFARRRGTNLDLTRVTSSGALDATFGTGGIATYATCARYAPTLYALGDQLLVAGGGSPCGAGLMLVDAAGSVVTGFGGDPGGMPIYDAIGPIEASARDSLGRVVFAASTDDYTSVSLLRVSADGTLDTSFGSGGVSRLNLTSAPTTETARSLSVLPDDTLILVGVFGLRGFTAAFSP